ncbi:MAG: U32 family peptidase [Melioribacteraceae bacterium]
MQTTKLELLSPAKDLECGIAAIDCGADAVYIGAPGFGARAAAGNSVEDISKLVNYARRYWAKVYVTVNTIIYDNELEEVRTLVTKLYGIGVDAIIFQDMALLEMDIPPIQLYASTQTHNYELERIKFLDALGIKRIILARELSLDQIKEIRESVNAELEFFVHGALCVCLSGQCYMSHAITGRSANRGECAQPCRMEYSLIDNAGRVIVKEKHLLSLRDLDLSAYLNDLIEAGITSFKIEGRLKDIGYVKNITAYYRQKLDALIEHNPSYQRSSSGYSIIPFLPDPERTFNRGYTSYFIDGKEHNLSSIDSPKSKGKYLGRVSKIDQRGFTIDTSETIITGDGICFLNDAEELVGMSITRVEGETVLTTEMKGIKAGSAVYRNYDRAFESELKKECVRKIAVKVVVDESKTGLRITASDESGVKIIKSIDSDKTIAEGGERAVDIFKKQFLKSGETIFNITDVKVNFKKPLFFPVKTINEFRRCALEMLEKERINRFKTEQGNSRRKMDGFKTGRVSPDKSNLDYRANVVNTLSEKFYKDLGAGEIEEGFELQTDLEGKTLMTCKYCIKDEIGCCPRNSDKKVDEPLYLSNAGKKYRLYFNCTKCQMEIRYD